MYISNVRELLGNSVMQRQDTKIAKTQEFSYFQSQLNYLKCSIDIYFQLRPHWYLEVTNRLPTEKWPDRRKWSGKKHYSRKHRIIAQANSPTSPVTRPGKRSTDTNKTIPISKTGRSSQSLGFNLVCSIATRSKENVMCMSIMPLRSNHPLFLSRIFISIICKVVEYLVVRIQGF